MKKLTYIALLLALAGCKQQGELAVTAKSPDSLAEMPQTPTMDPADHPPTPEYTPTPRQDPDAAVEPAPLADITADETTLYLRSISQMLVGRPLTTAENEQIQAEGPAAIRSIVQGWTREQGFADAARFMMSRKLKASGERDGIDFDLPGNLIEHIVKNDLPYAEVLTADYCIGASGEEIPCDSGAPYTAGVLTTRAYLAGNASRFNLGRAARMMKVFACRHYPMEDDLQPRLEKETLIPMFQAQTPEEQTVEEAKEAFGNGHGCYTCHGQFGAHAQPYVRFDETGMWIEGATGQQDPDGELGRSVNGLMTSHMIDPAEKAYEGTQIFGQQVENLAGAGRVISQSDVFIPCTVRNVIEHTFGLTDSAGEQIDSRLLQAVAARASAGGPPGLDEIVVETFVDPRVIAVVLSSKGPGDVQ
jgi:hypothetical protein